MNQNQQKINWKNILIAVMAGLMLFGIITNKNQANEIELLNNRINNLNAELNITQNAISSIYDNVDKQLKKQVSLLTSTEHTLGNLNTEKHTIDVEIKVVPKTVTDHMALSVKIGDAVTDFQRTGNTFTTVIPVAMFLDYDEARPILYIETDAGTQTEMLEDIQINHLYDRYLPTLHANIEHNTGFSKGKLEINSHIHVSAKPTEYSGSIAFSKYTLVTEINGKEIEREDITSKMENGNFDSQFHKTIDANQDDTVVIYVAAEDTLGYMHEAVAITWHTSDSGAVAEVMYTEESIYDKEGNLLSRR